MIKKGNTLDDKVPGNCRRMEISGIKYCLSPETECSYRGEKSSELPYNFCGAHVTYKWEKEG